MAEPGLHQWLSKHALCRLGGEETQPQASPSQDGVQAGFVGRFFLLVACFLPAQQAPEGELTSTGRILKIAATLPQTSIMSPEPYDSQHKSIIKRNHGSAQSGMGRIVHLTLC